MFSGYFPRAPLSELFPLSFLLHFRQMKVRKNENVNEKCMKLKRPANVIFCCGVRKLELEEREREKPNPLNERSPLNGICHFGIALFH